MSKPQQKVASWYWIVSAILTPFVVIACVLTGYFAYQSQAYRAEADRIVVSLKANHTQFEQIRDIMKTLGTEVGFVASNPEGFVDGEANRVKVVPGNAEEEQRPVQDRNYIYNKWREGEDLLRGGGKQMANYMSARVYLTNFERAIERYIAFKAYQIYDVKTIEIGNLPSGAAAPTPGAEGGPDRVVVAADVVERPGARRKISAELDAEAYLPPEAEMDAALERWRRGDPPREQSLRKPTAITLELVFRKQMHLLNELTDANVRQYGILIGEVSGGEVGYGGVEARKNQLATEVSDLNSTIGTTKNTVVSRMNTAATADGEIAGDANSNKSNYFDSWEMTRTGKLGDEARAFASQAEMHRDDVEAFRDLTRLIPRIKMPKAVPNSEWDGKVTYSDDKRGSIHINLGRLDNVVAGQRFEVWRSSGHTQDVFIGVIEIVRTLSDYVSLCTVLELANPSLPVRMGDDLLSHLWHKGRFLTVALHGTFDPPEQAFSKERLAALLKAAGCRVVEKLQPGTDLVITGSPKGLADDEWFKTARSDILVDTINEEMVRLYLAPR